MGSDIDLKARTKFVINPKDWSKAKGDVVHKRSQELRELSENLERLKADLIVNLNQSLSKSEIINLYWLKNFINPIKKIETNSDSLLDYIKKYELDPLSMGSKSLKEKCRQAYLKVARYEKNMQESIRISDVNAQLLQKMYYYFLSNEKYSEGTVVRGLKFIKTVCFYAQKKGIRINEDIRQLKLSVPASQPIYLSKDELIKIREVQLKQNYLDNARDWLLISCFTAQRVSDLMRNKYSDIEKKASGTMFLHYRQKKTKKDVSVIIPRVVEEILKKNGNSFPRPISSVNYNRYIKEVCRIAGIDELVEGAKAKSIPMRKIGTVNRREAVRKLNGKYPKWELITAHIGRRSFASNFTGNLPTYFVKAVTGHSSEAMLAKYIGRSIESFSDLAEEYFYPERAKEKVKDEFWGF